MPENPFWSVIVATYQRGKVLFDTIEYILALSYPHFAFLVIDQTPQHEADTEQFIRACKTKYAERFRWHFGARVNLPNARNVGAKMARGEYLLFCDDDIVPPANLIELHSRNLMEPGVGAATFGVYVERKKLPPQPRTCVILPYGPMLDSWENDVPKGTTDSRRDGNMSMSRKFAFEVGLFDDAYIGRSNGTETNLSLRILRKGYQIATTLTPQLCILATKKAALMSVETSVKGAISSNATTTTPTFSPRISSSDTCPGF